MQKIGDLTSTATPDGEFTDGVVAQGIVPTILAGDWFNTIQREIVNAVEGSGQVLDKTDFSQLAQALQVASVKRYPFNQAFSTAIGGYPKGAIILGIDGVTLWQSTIDSNITDPDSAGASGWAKIVDSAGLVKFMSDRFAFVYPNGGSEASPANITVNQRYVIPSPFPGHQFYSVPEIFYNNMWGDPKFIWYLAHTTTATGIGAATSQFSDNIILVTGALGFLGTPNHQGHPFVDPIPSLTSVPCRIKVWRVD